MPAAVVVDHDERGVERRGRRAPSRPLLSCRKQRSPSSATVGPVGDRRRRRATVDTKPSMPLTPRLARTSRRRAARRSSRRRAPACSTRRTSDAAVGHARHDVARDAPFERLVPAVDQRRRSRRCAAASASCPASHPRPSVDRHVDRVRERAEEQLGIGDHAPAGRVLRVEPRAVGIDQHLVDRRVEPLHRGLVGGAARRCAAPRRGGAPSANAGDAQQRVVGGDGAGHPQVRERVGEHRPAR